MKKNADPEKNNVPDYAPFSEMVTMQKAAETQDEGGVTENTDTEDSVDEEEKADAETNDEPAMENSGQVSETTDDGITSDNNGVCFHLMKICQQAYHIPVDSLLLPV